MQPSCPRPAARPTARSPSRCWPSPTSSFALLQSLIVPVLARIQVEFDTDQTTVTWVLTAYLLSASICTPLLGRIGDVVGKTRMLVIALVALAVGLAGGRAGAEHRLADRGAGAAGRGRRRAAAVVRDHPRRVPRADDDGAERDRVADRRRVRRRDRGGRPDRRRVRLPRAVLAARWSSRSSPRAAALLFVPESPVRTPARLPVLPALLLAGWLVALLLGLSEGNEWGWASARGARPVRGSPCCWPRLGRGRAAGAGADDRHADDAAPRRVDHQRGGRLRRVRDVRGVRLPAPAAPDAAARPATASAPRSPSPAACCCRPRWPASWSASRPPALIRVLRRPRGDHDRAAHHRVRRSPPSGSCTTRPGSCTPPRPSRASAPDWSSPAWPAWWSPRCPREQTGVASGMNANIRTIGGSLGRRGDGRHHHRPARRRRLPGRARLHRSASWCSAW